MKIRNKDWFIVSSLMLLSLIPVIAGIIRIVKVATGEISLDNARFLLNPAPIVSHILIATVYSLLGALQFAPGIRTKWPHWHRVMGTSLVVLGAVVAISGIWMTLMYPSANYDGVVVYYSRLIVGVMMLSFTVFGIEALRQKKYIKHGEWMLRTYAIAMGAGTQVLTHLPLLIFPTIKGEVSRSVFMTLGWLINLAVAEWIVLEGRRARSIQSSTLTG